MSIATAEPLTGSFVRPPDLDPERVRYRWALMRHPERRRFLAAIGPRAALREFRLPVIEVAMAWQASLPTESKLAHCRALAAG